MSAMRSFVVLGLLLAWVTGCATAGDPGSGGDDDDDGVDASGPPATDDPDGGGGAAPDASLAPDGATPTSDAAIPPVGGAAALGKLCNAATPCPAGYSCLSLRAGAIDQFCTLPCTGSMDTTSCTIGYTGAGAAGCFLADNPAMPTAYFCALGCGPDIPWADGSCPINLTCVDLDGNGVNDLCSN